MGEVIIQKDNDKWYCLECNTKLVAKRPLTVRHLCVIWCYEQILFSTYESKDSLCLGKKRQSQMKFSYENLNLFTK